MSKINVFKQYYVNILLEKSTLKNKLLENSHYLYLKLI